MSDSIHGWCFECKLPCFLLAGTCRGCAGRAVPVPPELAAEFHRVFQERRELLELCEAALVAAVANGAADLEARLRAGIAKAKGVA